MNIIDNMEKRDKFKKKHNNIYVLSANPKIILGFWIYLMSDCIVFAIFFAVYDTMIKDLSVNMHVNNIFNISLVEKETLILLFSSVACCLATIYAKFREMNKTIFYLIITFILGCCFIRNELTEFIYMISNKLGPNRDGFLSSFFALVGLHGLHIIIGLLWILITIVNIYKLKLNKNVYTRIICFSLFWHFLDIMWIFIFSIVYLISINSYN